MDIVKATELAMQLYETLKPHCQLINIAGSVRRRCEEVGDLELICIPKTEPLHVQNLFGTDSTETVSYQFIRAVDSLGMKIKGNGYLKYCQIALHDVNMNLDLFIPDQADYYRQYAIRTGPAEYSHKVLAAGWRRIGWVGSDIGLRLYADCREISNPDGSKRYVCERNKDKRPPAWKSEAEFFKWLEIPYKEPKDR